VLLKNLDVRVKDEKIADKRGGELQMK
jgi:hypothetical protein